MAGGVSWPLECSVAWRGVAWHVGLFHVYGVLESWAVWEGRVLHDSAGVMIPWLLRVVVVLDFTEAWD
jgi:hypothetical protein